MPTGQWALEIDDQEVSGFEVRREIIQERGCVAVLEGFLIPANRTGVAPDQDSRFSSTVSHVSPLPFSCLGCQPPRRSCGRLSIDFF